MESQSQFFNQLSKNDGRHWDLADLKGKLTGRRPEDIKMHSQNM